MSSRIPLVLGLAAVVAMAAWRIGRGGGADDTAPAPATATAPATAPGTAAVAPRASDAPHARSATALATATPALPAPRAVTPARLPPDAFVAEPRDDRWARATEADLQRRLAGATGGVHATTLECKTTTCKLALAGDAFAVSGAFDALGARVPMTLSAAQVGSDGAAVVTAFLTYPPRYADTSPDQPD